MKCTFRCSIVNYQPLNMMPIILFCNFATEKIRKIQDKGSSYVKQEALQMSSLWTNAQETANIVSL